MLVLDSPGNRDVFLHPVSEVSNVRRRSNGLERFPFVLFPGPEKRGRGGEVGLDLSNGEVTFSNRNYLQQLAPTARLHLHGLHGNLSLHAPNQFKGNNSRQILWSAMRKITKAVGVLAWTNAGLDVFLQFYYVTHFVFVICTSL